MARGPDGLRAERLGEGLDSPSAELRQSAVPSLDRQRAWQLRKFTIVSAQGDTPGPGAFVERQGAPPEPVAWAHQTARSAWP